MNTRSCLVRCIFLCIAVIPSILSAQVYVLTDLSMQDARGINDSGAVTGFTWSGGDLYSSNLWENGGFQGLGALAPGGATTAFGINNKKQIVGSSYTTSNVASRHAFLWDATMTDLGTMGGQYADAIAINDTGEIAGVVFDSLGASGFFWKNGVVTDLGTLGQKATGVGGMNDSGQVVGSSGLNDTVVHAFLWDNGSLSDLGTLGGNFSAAQGVNNLGQSVGWSSLSGPYGSAATLWSGGSASNLGIIAVSDSAPEADQSNATDINDAGEVVGWSTWQADPRLNPTHAFVWRNGVMTDLNSVADTAGGWILTRAIGINNKGDIICLAQNGYAVRSVLLTKKNVIVTYPGGFETFIAGENETIRWKSGLAAGATVKIEYSADDGLTWTTIAAPVAANLEKYVWRVAEVLSDSARIRVSATADPSKFDDSQLFILHPYVITKTNSLGVRITYDINTDRWGFGNSPEDVWDPTWWNRFDYHGTDPKTGRNYLLGGPVASTYFLWSNRSDFPDWPAFVDAFQVYHCYWNTTLPVYSPAAVIRWASVKEGWNGSCFGFAISNAWCYRRKPDFRAVYTQFPDYLTPISVLSDSNSISTINSVFTHQFGRQHQEYRATVGLLKTPTQTLNDLRQMLVSNDEPIRTLSFLNNGFGGGGHAILAYKLMRDSLQPNIFHVFVYDNAHPNDTAAEIIIDSAANGGNGIWTNPLWPGWGGVKWIYLRDPAEQYVSPPDLKGDPDSRESPFSLPDGELEVHVLGAARTIIADSAGNVTGFADTLSLGIPGSVPLVLDNAVVGPPYGYSLGMQPCALTLGGMTDTALGVFIFNGNRSFAIHRFVADSIQSDRIFFDGGVSISNPDPSPKSYDITGVLDERSQGREKAFLVRSLTVGQDDSVRISIVSTDGLEISSFDTAAKSYRLDLEYDAASGTKQFTHDSIPLPGNASHLIQPGWPALAPDGSLNILIDYGNDGSVDDSMIVSNQTTGVDDGPGELLPTAFTLQQNYPNPFNPVTTIGYELPRATHVTLKIYDVFGREVATLVDREEGAGYKSVEWNAADAASGVYFYTLRAGEFAETKKLIVVR